MADCICVLCVGDNCGCSVQDPDLPRLSCTGCRPTVNAKPLSADEWGELNKEFDEGAHEEAHDEAYRGNIYDPEDKSWRQWDCYTCKDTGHCPNCETEWED